MTKLTKQSGIWALYDFANSFAIVVFGIYFSQWLVIDHHASDLKYNLIFVFSSFLLLITAPILGVIVDKGRTKLPALRIVTAYSFVSLLFLSLLAQVAPPTTVVLDLVLALAVIAQYFFQLSYVFYNPLLKELGDTTEQAQISGVGEAAAGLGQLAGLLVTLPFATGVIYLIGHHDESQVFLPTALFFLCLALPMVLFFKEKSQPSKAPVKVDVLEEWHNIYQHFLDLRKHPGVLRFLLAFFFFNDAILTAGHNFPIYVQRIFHVDEQMKVILIGAIVIASAVGALTAGWLAKYVGEKKLMLAILACWAVFLPVTALQQELPEFIVCMSVVGLLLGSSAAIARAVMAYLSPPEEATHIFSYYAMTSRLASFLGPVSWGLITYSLRHYGLVRYQVALAAMTVFVIIGFLLVRGVPGEEEIVPQVRARA